MDVQPSVERHGSFLYEPLEDKQFRLFHLSPGRDCDPLEGRLFHEKLSIRDQSPYEALSYCWGDSTQVSPLYIEQESCLCGTLHITTSLEEALRYLRYPNRIRILWIDSICINQTNILEKNYQVSIMRLIYERASNVLVWLGPASDNSGFGMEVIRYLTRKPDRHPRTPWETQPPPNIRAGLIDIMSRPWFQRMWVIQEATVATIVTIICGHDTLSWPGENVVIVQRIKKMLQFAVTSPKWEQAGLKDINLDPLFRILHSQEGNQLDRNYGSSHRPSADLLDLMYDMRYKSATDPRDMIFALSGLVVPCAFADYFEPDYSLSLEENYERLWEELRLWERSELGSILRFTHS